MVIRHRSLGTAPSGFGTGDNVRRLCAAVLWNAEARRIAANGEATVPTPEELEAMLAQRQARYAEPHWGAP